MRGMDTMRRSRDTGEGTAACRTRDGVRDTMTISLRRVISPLKVISMSGIPRWMGIHSPTKSSRPSSLFRQEGPMTGIIESDLDEEG